MCLNRSVIDGMLDDSCGCKSGGGRGMCEEEGGIDVYKICGMN